MGDHMHLRDGGTGQSFPGDIQGHGGHERGHRIQKDPSLDRRREYLQNHLLHLGLHRGPSQFDPRILPSLLGDDVTAIERDTIGAA